MTALAADRNTPSREGTLYEYPVAAATEIFAGSLVVLDASGDAAPGSTATGLVAVGRAEEYVNNPGAAGAERVRVRAGTFAWVNGDTITKAHIGDTAYITDDQTVAKLGTSKSPAGRIVDVDSDGVWVRTDPLLALATTGLVAANNLSDVGSAATARDNLQLTGSTADLELDTVTSRQKLIAGGAAYTVGSENDGDAVIHTATDNAVVTLPDAAAANAGQRVTVQATGDDGAQLVTVRPHSSDAIFGTIPNAAADSVSDGVVDKDFNLTKATMNKGDHVVLVSDGATGWFIVGGVGIWASEP